MNPFILGLDLGQSNDFTAVAIAEVAGDLGAQHYAVRYLRRFDLGTPYPTVVSEVRALTLTPQLRGCHVVADATGVGRPVLDMLDQARMNPTAVTITGGDTVTSEDGHFRVPKRDLVSTVQVLLQSGRLKIASALPEAETLVKELLNFQVKITANAHDVYGAWREGTHDDLVLAVALACWWGEHSPGRAWLKLIERGIGFGPWDFER
ncbi:MAG: hypothetical protein ACHQQS_02865 [Thermoanaerobaculales bacterium]